MSGGDVRLLSLLLLWCVSCSAPSPEGYAPVVDMATPFGVGQCEHPSGEFLTVATPDPGCAELEPWTIQQVGWDGTCQFQRQDPTLGLTVRERYNPIDGTYSGVMTDGECFWELERSESGE